LKVISWRLISIIGILVVSVLYILPTLRPGVWPYKKINLGLDLQGGMHLVLEVEVDKAVESTVDRLYHEMRTRLKQEGIRHGGLERVKTPAEALAVQLSTEDQLEKFNTLLDKEYADLAILDKSESGGQTALVLGLRNEDADHIKRLAVDQALETIRNRIDEFGVSEPDIRRQGDRRILIQLPGIKDPQRAKDLIGRTALLEFKLVDESRDPAKISKGSEPPGTQLLHEVRTDPSTNRTIKTPYLLKKRAALTGAYLTDARVMIDNRYNEPYVSLEFDKKGAKIFAKVTREHKKERLAIVLDNNVYSAPVIQDEIPNGQAQITGNFSMDEARDLAIVLRAGALPAPVKILEERTVGPSLGADSIKAGRLSMMVGGLVVVIFMVIYYNFAGIIADIALAMNILIVAAGLAMFQATLTLPGIAGIILTIGLAVDANVLVFERIREELSRGKPPRAAVEAGYARSALTILDANVTTLIAAVVLFQFGTGPIKGFAVTLSLGVLASLFTALILSRSIFDYLLITRKQTRLSI